MESAGLQRIITSCQEFGVRNIDKQIRILQGILDDDEQRLRERLNEEILKDLNNPQDVYNAIISKVQDTKAHQYFLSMMQHLLLIREEGKPMVHYYQLLDSLVTDVVLDKKLAGAEQRLGTSVERIIAQFNEADRYQVLEEEANIARAEIVRLRLEKDVLEDEVAQGQEGLVGRLKTQVNHLEQKLNVSRETTSRLQGQLETQKAGYEEQIRQLEAQIMELFRMLKEVGKRVDGILENGENMDRKTLIQTLERHFQRNKTISILEGRDYIKKKGRPVDDEPDEEDDTDTTPRKIKSAKKKSRKDKTTTLTERDSQFMDAEEADAQEQIQQQLATGATTVCI
jgi:cytokinesis protein